MQLPDNDLNLMSSFFSTVLNIIKLLKEITDKELKEARTTTYEQIENINKDTEIIKRSQREFLELIVQ